MVRPILLLIKILVEVSMSLERDCLMVLEHLKYSKNGETELLKIQVAYLIKNRDSNPI